MSKILNVEIKAKCRNPEQLHDHLVSLSAEKRGLDHQIDTYFNCERGRLKLREGNIENSLIFYQRSDQAGPKSSDIALARFKEKTEIAEVLKAAYGEKVVVDKKRQIFYIDNVKFHIDEVKDLGSFMEIEARDEDGTIGLDKLQAQCKHYMELFQIEEDDLIEISYSDLILNKKN